MGDVCSNMSQVLINYPSGLPYLTKVGSLLIVAVRHIVVSYPL